MLGALAPHLGSALAGHVALKLGPNDSEYLRGFRDDWERDGPVIFRWTTPSARVDLPVKVKGEGWRLRLRARRHFYEPAQVRLGVEGRTVAAFAIQAGEDSPYRLFEFALPALEGQHPFSLSIESSSENPRPLGIALDWIELERSTSGRVTPPEGAAARGAWVGAAAFLPALLGGSLALTAAPAVLTIGALGGLAALDPLACARVLRDGCGPFVFTALLVVLVLGLPRSARCLSASEADATPASVRAGLALLVLVGLALRLGLLLHPRFYYPDVRIHALFVRELARTGIPAFLAHFTDNQFRYSLGLQFESGHWYAFPYPPVFYLLCGPLSRWLGYSPEAAASIVPAVVNALEVLVVFAIARRLRLGLPVAVAGAALVPLLPLFLVRLSLAYFPALTGHAVDALVVLSVVTFADRFDRLRAIATTAGLVALALLTYTQSLVNLGVLLPLFLLAQVLRDRGPRALRRHLGLALAGALGAALALGVFYARYVPVFVDMQRGVPMAGESIVLERLARLQVLQPEAPVEEQDDPYAQPTTDLLRGVRKAGHRLRIFYGPFALAIACGFSILIKRSEPVLRRFVVLWGLTFVLVCIGSGGLPGPNLLRYAKELEFVAPLCAISIAICGAWLWARLRPLGALYAVGWGGYAVARLVTILAERVMTLQR